MVEGIRRTGSSRGARSIAALAAIIAGVLLLGLPGAAAAADPNAVVTSPADEARTDAASIWTEQRMRRAQPLDEAAADPGIEAESAGRLARDAGTDPELLGADATPFATVGKDRPVKAYMRYPARTHGRIFGTIPGSGDFTCSGTLVSSAGKNVVYTAGHCVYDKQGGQNMTNLAFTPAYKQGVSNYGVYDVTQVHSLAGWRDRGFPQAYSYDVAVMTLDQPLERLIGARGLKTGVKPRGKRFDIFGYPARPNPPYDAERPIHCPKARFVGREDQLYPVAKPSVIAGPCNMMQGSSGGGWIIKGRFVNSVVSHGFCDTEPQLCGITHGPFFGAGARFLYEAAGGGRAKPTESDFCRPVSAELRKAKRAKRKATKQKRRAKKQLRRAKRKDKRGKARKAKQRIERASKRKRRANKRIRAGTKLSDTYRC